MCLTASSRKPVYPGGLQVPGAPAVQLGQHLRVVHIQVGPHQVVVVTVLPIHVPVPLLALKLVDALFLVRVVPVHTVKMAPIPAEITVFSAPAWKVKAGVGADALLPAHLPVAVPPVVLLRQHLFTAVGPHAVVEHHVGIHLYPGALQGPDGVQVFIPRAVFCGNGALLVELAQIIGVIDGVAHVFPARGALVGGRQPRPR